MTKLNFTHDGYKLYFHTAESPWEQPHFNLEPASGEWKLKVKFQECTEKHLEYEIDRAPNRQKNWTPPIKKKKELLILIVRHRDEIQGQWDEIISAQWPDGFER